MALDQHRWLAVEKGAQARRRGRRRSPGRPLADDVLPGGTQTALDLAHDYAAAGLLDEAVDVLRRDLTAGSRSAGSRSAGPRSGSAIVGYTLGWLLGLAGAAEAAEELARAEEMLPDYCFPARLEEIDVLESAMAQRPQDARAPYYLGNLFYDRRRYDDAIRVWRRAAQLDPAFPTAHRNLGLAEFNVLGRRQEALACYHRAFAAAPSDARVLYELDQLRRRCDVAPVERVRLLEESRPLVGSATTSPLSTPPS